MLFEFLKLLNDLKIAGGIDLSEVEANTMMSRKIKNLFFAGEVLDVDGITGGFNYTHGLAGG